MRHCGPSLPKKILFATVTVVGLFVAIELSLLLAGVKPAYLADDRLVDFSTRASHFVQQPDDQGGTVVTVAPSRQAAFNKLRFSARKSAGTYRIFCVGGSTTYGRPFWDGTSMAGWLRAFLPVADPSRTWEVINAGAISYASYRVVGVMRELCRYQPDLFVVYTGQNEFLERHTYQSLLNRPWLVREAIGLAWRTRTATVIRYMFQQAGILSVRARREPIILGDQVKAIPVNAVGPDAYHRNDRLKEQVVAGFRRNLERMIAVARGVGAVVVLVVPASNLADFAPFKSVHRAAMSAAEIKAWNDLYQAGVRAMKAGDAKAALAALQRAEAMDDRYAELHYRLGHVLLELHDDSQARRQFERAREEDICPLRAIAAITDTVRQVASRKHVPLVDFDHFVTDHSAGHIPGAAFFHDHVHPTVEANRDLALEIVTALTDAGIVRPSPDWGKASIATVTAGVEAHIDRPAHAAELFKLSRMLEWLGQHEAARKKAAEALQLAGGTADALYQMGLLDARQGDPATAALYFRRALDRRPKFAAAQWQLGAALAAQGETDQAIDHLTRAIQWQPDLAPAHTRLGVLLTGAGRLEQARIHFAKVVELEPDSDAAQNNLGLALLHLGRCDEAIEHFRRAIQLNPNNSSAELNCGMAFERVGKPAAAARCYRAVLRLKPDHQDARARLRTLTSDRH